LFVVITITIVPAYDRLNIVFSLKCTLRTEVNVLQRSQSTHMTRDTTGLVLIPPYMA